MRAEQPAAHRLQLHVYIRFRPPLIADMTESARVILLVIDACGVGELPDADRFGDAGAATLPHVAIAVGGLAMPNCRRLGLGNIVPIEGVPPVTAPAACYGKMAERAAGKDSTAGHWELGGVIIEKPFPLFPDGFPGELVAEFERRAGVRTVGNVAASGTEIIERLGEHHLETGDLILYTSADSVFQLAAHEEIFSLDELYDICLKARRLLQGEYGVGRVIARPFVGQPGEFTRTTGRRDFSLEPPEDTVLDVLERSGRGVLAVGKIKDLYAGRGITTYVKTSDNDEVMHSLTDVTTNDRRHALIMANLVDFDMLWGHRNDEVGFARGLESFDQALPALLGALRKDDILIITADHGCDPTIKSSTDHTREYVPLLVYGNGIKTGVDLGTRETFADIAATISELFGLDHTFPGRSFLRAIMREDRNG